jgi:hypothetical protein
MTWPALQTTCPSCGLFVRYPEQLGGRLLPCPQCGYLVPLPAPRPAPLPAAVGEPAEVAPAPAPAPARSFPWGLVVVAAALALICAVAGWLLGR